jgi:hypothetical protein
VTENPRAGSSILTPGTILKLQKSTSGFFCLEQRFFNGIFYGEFLKKLIDSTKYLVAAIKR